MKPLGSAAFICAGRWQLTVASIAPYLHLSTHSGSFPAFRLNTDSGIQPSAAQSKPIRE
jgi:hypothetical protein